MVEVGSRVGLRELRHHTREVVGRVRRGETADVTDRGQLVARIVPMPTRPANSVLDALEADGMLIRATRPGFHPKPLAGDGTESASRALQDDRQERLP